MRKCIRKTYSVKRSRRLIALLACLCLLATLIPAIPGGSKEVQAEEGSAEVKTINLDASVLRPSNTWSSGGNLVYYGSYGGNPTAYRILPSSEETQTVETESGVDGCLLLDCDTILTTMAFDSSKSCKWSGSDLETWLNNSDFYESTDVFSVLEKAAIAETILSGIGIAYTINGASYIDYGATDYVFCLSAGEANCLYKDNSARKKQDVDYLWLRSYCNFYSVFTYVDGAGDVESDGHIYGCIVSYNSVGVSPAFNIDLSSVLFASSVSGADKTSELTEIGSIGSTSSNAWKLTLLDDSMKVSLQDGAGVTAEEKDGGTVITVPYAYENGSVDANQISVMITDKKYDSDGATVLYYGALQDVTISSTAGTGTFALPEDLETQTCGEDYYAYIIAEAVNGKNKTDYASAPCEITIPEVKAGDTTAEPTTEAAQTTTEDEVASTEDSKNSGATASAPAAKGTQLTDSASGLIYKVTSSDASNPTVSVAGIADSAACEITIPAKVTMDNVTYKVTAISARAFKGNTKLTAVTIGKNVTAIRKGAFSGCTALKEVTLGKNVEIIGRKAFYNCTKLAGITIPKKVTKIYKKAFSGCTALKEVTLGKNVELIGKKAFADCKKLKGISKNLP